MTGSGVNLHSGDPFHVHITYDGTNLAMTITDTTTNGSFSYTWPISIPSTVEGNTAYVGFTGGTGGLTAIQDIQTWTFTNGARIRPQSQACHDLRAGGYGGDDHWDELRIDAGDQHGEVFQRNQLRQPTSWSATASRRPVPSGATTGNVVVTVGGVASNGVNFTVTTTGTHDHEPVNDLGTGRDGGDDHWDELRIHPRNQHGDAFNGTAATATSWSATSLATSGAEQVPRRECGGDGRRSGQQRCELHRSPTPSITSLVCVRLRAGGDGGDDHGTNFGSTQGTSTVKFNGTTATATSWSATSMHVRAGGATTGNVVVTVGGVASNGVSFTVAPAPSITSLSVSSGPVGTAVTITGTNFGSTQGTSTVNLSTVQLQRRRPGPRRALRHPFLLVPRPAM